MTAREAEVGAGRSAAERGGTDVQTVPESEIKLAVPAGGELDVRAAVGGPVAAVAEPTVAVLRTTYYDTSDLRLARHGMTLRRRLGDDEGWHLKVPAGVGGPENRLEIRTSPQGSTPPAELLDLVRAHTRFAPVAEVATLETTRRTARLLGPGGESLGVVVDDLVRVLEGERERERFREVEVEAAPDAADPAALLAAVVDRLVAAGSVRGDQTPKAVRALGPAAREPAEPPPPPEVSATGPAAAAVTAHLRTQARAFLRHDLGVRRDLPDAVHQMRVSARRLRSTLRTFAPLLAPDRLDELSAELAWAADVLGEVRDREVLLARLERHIAALVLPAEEVGALAEYVDRTLGGEMATARSGVLEMLHSERYLHLVEHLVAVASAPPLAADAERPATEVLPPLLAAAAQALGKRGRRLTPASPDEAYHRARIAAKRARYAGELTAGVLGAPAKALARAAEAVQEVLGEHQDAVVAAEAAAGLLTPDAPAGRAFGLGMLTAYERSAALQARQAFPAVWADYEAVSLPS